MILEVEVSMNARAVSLFLLLPIALEASMLWAFSDLHNAEPSEWTGQDVYQILNNSPWSKTLKMNFSNDGANAFGNQNAGAGANTGSSSPPAGAGGMGRRGMGGGRTRTYSSGGGGAPASAPKSGPTEVTLQWQSALVVRMAAAKKAGDPVNAESLKPLDEYVVAVIGLPITAVGGRAASVDSDNTLSADEERRLEEHVKTSVSLLRSGHEPLTPSKVELDQGADGRMLIHFPKSDPIKAADKSVEFRLVTGHGELRKKFPLKDMEYQGKLEL
jgi:hypothetical protein